METMHKRLPRSLLIFGACALLSSAPLLAQVPVDEDGNPLEVLDESVDSAADISPADEDEAPILTAEELETLVGPIALYPDKLLAIVLPASTYPLEIVQAARFLEELEEDSSLEPDESWDDSVTALLNYPEVVAMMNEDLDWTWRLGEAVVRQQPDVIAAVEAFRDRAYAAGNLKSDERQTVRNSDGVLEIEPVSEEIIYVPYYEPERVVEYQPRQVYYYYPRPYPVYYYPYPQHHAFSAGYFWGVTTAFRIGWATDHLHVFHHSYWGHPYYGRHYWGSYYRRPSITVYNRYYPNGHRSRSEHHHRDGDVWRPRREGGARPGYYGSRVGRAGDRQRERTVEGYRTPERNRAGFIGEAERNASGAASRRGFAASRDRANARNRAGTERAAVRREARSDPADNTVRFRPRPERSDTATAANPARERARTPAANRPDRSPQSRPAERRNSDQAIRFRSRDRSSDNNTSTRTRPSAEAARSVTRPRVAGSTRGNDSARSSATRERAAAAPAARPAPSNSRLRSTAPPSSSQAAKPAARPGISRRQPTQRSAPRRATAPRAAPQPRSSAPARAKSATRTAPARASRAAPSRRGSGAATRGARTRDH